MVRENAKRARCCRTMRRGVASLLCSSAMFALLAVAPACSDLDPGGNSSTFAARPVIVPDSPTVEITSPQRATFHSPGTVTVAGTTAPADDSQAPVTRVVVAGMDVPLAADGTFTTQVTLVPGLNTIAANAFDANGIMGSTIIGVLAGEWNPKDTSVPSAAAARLNEVGMDGLAAVLEEVARGLDLQALLGQTPIYDGTLLGFINAVVFLVNPVIGDFAGQLDARPDGLYLNIVGTNVVTDVDAAATAFGGTLLSASANVTADTITVTGRALIDVDPATGLATVRFEDQQVSFTNFKATFNSGNILVQALLPLLQGIIRNAVQGLLEDEIDNLEPTVNQALADVMQPTVPLQFLGKDFLYKVLAESATFDDDGVGLSLGIDTPPVATQIARAQNAPGSFRTPGMMPALATTNGIVLTFDDDGLNRLLFGAWAAGLLEADLSAGGLGGLNLQIPGLTSGSAGAGGGLTAGDLAQILPEILTAVDPDDPISVRVEAGLPPVIEVLGQPDLLRFHLGELYLDLLVDRQDGAGFELLARIALHAQATAGAVLDPSRGILLTSTQNAQIAVDVLDAPIVNIRERNVQVLLSAALTPLIPRLINDVNLFPIPAFLQQLTFFDLQARADGADMRHLTLTVELQR